jgi:KUP system potassium uptake protein
VLLGVFATALFYGDSMITPAISVLSAVEGLTTVDPRFEPFVIPIASASWSACSRSSARHGQGRRAVRPDHARLLRDAGGARASSTSSSARRSSSQTLNPLNAVNFFMTEPAGAPFLALGSVVLAVTGAEALYADMGHFGRKPIGCPGCLRHAGLMLNYMGQGAMLLSLTPAEARELVKNPFFFLAPEACACRWSCSPPGDDHRQPGGDLRRLLGHAAGDPARLHPAPAHHPHQRVRRGQIYIPVINWALMVMVILLVLTFQLEQPRRRLRHRGHRRDVHRHLPDRGGALSLWKWPRGRRAAARLFFIVDIAYFGANLTKVPDGGWFPLLVGVVAFTLLTTWAKGRKLMIDRMARRACRWRSSSSPPPTAHPRARHRRVHDQRRRRAPRAAPQPQAQQGAARAGDAADRPDRGRALCRGGSASRPRTSAAASSA